MLEYISIFIIISNIILSLYIVVFENKINKKQMKEGFHMNLPIDYFKPRLKLLEVIFLVTIHLISLYACCIWNSIMLETRKSFCIFYIVSALSVTVVLHRYYSHKSFESRPFLRFFFLYWQDWLIKGTYYVGQEIIEYIINIQIH